MTWNLTRRHDAGEPPDEWYERIHYRVFRELTLIFKDHEYVLKAGDAASYNAFDDYVYKNTGKGMVTANIVVHYSN